MRTGCVVVVDVFGEDASEVTLAEDDRVIEPWGSKPDPHWSDGVLPVGPQNPIRTARGLNNGTAQVSIQPGTVQGQASAPSASTSCASLAPSVLASSTAPRTRRRTIWPDRGEQAIEDQLTSFPPSVGTCRGTAAGLEGSHEGSLSVGLGSKGRLVDACEALSRITVVGAALDCQRALRRRRQHLLV